MNMISTGAFLNGMDASKNQSDLAKKFAAVWEKKNAKAARAGGVSLMALSLAACGGSSSTSTTTTTDTTTTTTTDAAQSLTLTKYVDDVTGGSGDDTITADSTVDATSNLGDTVDGGAGNDTFKLYVDDTNAIQLPVAMSNVENIYIYDNNTVGEAEDFSIASLTDVTAIEIDAGNAGATGTSTVADTRFVLTVGAGQTVTLDGLQDGLDADTANEEGEFEIGSAAAVTSIDLVVDGVGDKNTTGANTGDLDVDIAGTGVTTLNLTSAGSAASYIGIINSGAGLTTVTAAGDQLIDADTDAVTTLTSIDASATTGGVKFNVTGSTGDVTFTGGSGNDTLIVGGDLDIYDTIDGGDGTDTVSVTAATLTAATNATVKGINNLTSIEKVVSSATSTLTINSGKMADISNFGNTGTITGTGATGSAAGSAGIAFTFTNGDTLTIGANVTGGVGSADASEEDGGDGINAAAGTDTGSDSVTIHFAAGAATTITGGAGVASGTDDGSSGDAIDVSTVENITITTASKTDDVTLTAGAVASSGTVGETITVGANATITLSGAGDVNLGTVNAAAGTSADDLTVDGSAMTGVLTVVTEAGNDVIKGGSKADSLTPGAGANTVTTGGGADTVYLTASESQSLTVTTTITDFTAGSGGDVLSINGDTANSSPYDALTATQASTASSQATLAAAVSSALGNTSDDSWTAFSFGGTTYALFRHDDTTFNATEEAIVVLTGVEVGDLIAANFAIT